MFNLRQVRYIYKKVENNNLGNVAMLKQEIEEDRFDKDNEMEVKNLCQNMIINDF